MQYSLQVTCFRLCLPIHSNEHLDLLGLIGLISDRRVALQVPLSFDVIVVITIIIIVIAIAAADISVGDYCCWYDCLTARMLIERMPLEEILIVLKAKKYDVIRLLSQVYVPIFVWNVNSEGNVSDLFCWYV